MDILIAGLASGALMAQTFVAVGCVTAFFIVKNPPAPLAVFLARFPPGAAVIGVVVASYPVWGIVGVIWAFLFLALRSGIPGAGLGSPNLAYTLGVSVASIALAIPLTLAFRRLWPFLSVMTVSSAGIFGWLLPFLAS